MINWTSAAQAALDRHLAAIRGELLNSGSDLALTAAQLRRFIETQLAEEGITEPGEPDVERILAGAAAAAGATAGTFPPPPPRVPQATAVSAAATKPERPGGLAQGVVGLFGVALPLAALAIEFFTHPFAAIFDTIPTPLHVGAIALVAVANFLGIVLLLQRHPGVPQLEHTMRLNAVVAGIATFYSVWLAYVTPFALLGILAFGLGLLPLSPLISLLVASWLRRQLRRKAGRLERTAPRFWPWFGVGLGLLVALEAPRVVEAWALPAISAPGEAAQARGLWLLRQTHRESALRRLCYREEDGFRDTFYGELFGRTSLEQRQQAYYRVTGRVFNQAPAPSSRRWGAGRARNDAEEWVWDDAQGGEGVGRRLKLLTLQESRLDGTVDGDAATGYLEWTLVFRNDHAFQQREARALVQLPPGGVVSRLTLWVDGEEREAAFGGRSAVRQAYQAIVEQRRDPVLVSAKGPDQVLVQCFPVAPHGGAMKIRLGITVPLVLETNAVARLALPRVLEQNYSAAPTLTHAVWIEATQELTSALSDYRAEISPTKKHVLRGALSPAQFAASEASLAIARSPDLTTRWARHPQQPDFRVIQTLALQPAAGGPLVIVVDGSRDMGAKAKSLARQLDELPAAFPVRLSVAGDRVRRCPTSDPRGAAAWLSDQEFAGGQDATAALREAADFLAGEGGTLLWVHGAQPLAWREATALEQTLARRRGRIRLLAFAAVPGPNLLLEKLGGSPDLAVWPRFDDVASDLKRALDAAREGMIVATRVIQPDSVESPTGLAASDHLVRLWAAEEVRRLVARGPANYDAAVRLAVRFQLVTAVSSAVVLENARQYRDAGLQPVDPATVPQVPETGATLGLLALALVVLVALKHGANRRGPWRGVIRESAQPPASAG